MKSRLVLHARVVTGTGGGPDKTILNSTRYLKDDGYQMLCAYLRHPDDPLFAQLEQRAREFGARLAAVDDFGPLDWRVAGRLRRICRENRPAIWHGHDYKSNLLGLMVRRSVPMSLVTTVHGWVRHTSRTPLYYAVDRHCLRRYDQVICVSRDLFDRCLHLGVPVERCWLIDNAVDLEDYRRRDPTDSGTGGSGKGYPKGAENERHGLAQGRLLVGAVGRLSPEKGFHHLVLAISRLIAKGIDCELWIAGEGDERSALAREVAARGLDSRVRLLGFRADCRALYEAMDVFALPSLREGLPNSLLEAMAYELPVVATPVGGVASLVDDTVNGLLVAPDSADALAVALEKLAEDPELRARLGRAARETIERSHGFAERMRKVGQVYERALAQREVAA